jgi:glycosyltransferase involved in cell wall biosynthesis
MFNREKFIARTINSILRQSYRHFETIIVDDGSIDKSNEVVKGYSDPRIKLFSHKSNRGVGPARNTGISRARGNWVLFLDSDDELLPGALSLIDNRAGKVSNSVSRLNFMVQFDSGELSPFPPFNDELFDYIRYIKWMESCSDRLQESIQVTRRETFRQVRFFNDRTLEGPYHLDFMKRFLTRTFPDLIAWCHQDAENQLTKPDLRRTIRDAHDQASSGELMLMRHSKALKLYAPRIYKKNISGLATLFFLSGDRRKGVKYSFDSLRHDFFSMRNLIIFLIGLINPKLLAFLKTIRLRIRQRGFF